MKEELCLNGTWQLAALQEGATDFAQHGPPFPIEAPVPGEVHPSLEAAGVVPDLGFGANVCDVAWVEDKEWWYRRAIDVPEEFTRTRSYLEFDGLDTFATVLMNGHEVGSAENMYIRYRFDVTDHLRPGEENLVEVRFRSTARITERMDLDGYYVRYNPLRIGARKMQTQFGWDFAPRTLGAGIWRDARLTSCDRASIEDLYIRPTLMGDRAEANVAVEVKNHTEAPVELEIRLAVEGPDLRVQRTLFGTVPPEGATLEEIVEIDHPHLWWPNGYGEQPLYTASAELRADGKTLDETSQRFAIRTVELKQEDDEGKPAFYFVINGQPLFVKGANWPMADAFPSRVTDARYRELLGRAREAHMNMMRVWGGGTYEKPLFYDLCDEYGIMVWQDFMFSLAEHPETPHYLALVDQEARAIIRQLRNHPCVVLWCGNNECRMNDPLNDDYFGRRYFDQTIPRAAEDLDGTRPYWTSSPYGGDPPRSPEKGDFHGEPWFKYAAGMEEDWRKATRESEAGLFMSEFPTQGVPEMVSLRRFLPEDAPFPPQGKVWEVHLWNNDMREEQEGYSGMEMLMRLIRKFMGEPKDLETYARLGGIAQGEFLQGQISHYRRKKLAIGGSQLWMFPDPWPSVDYSIMDYYLRPKPAYWFTRRVYEPVALLFDEEDNGQGACAWVVNDRPERVRGVAHILITDLEGGRETRYGPVCYDIPPNRTQKVWGGIQVDDPSRRCLIGWLETDDGRTSPMRYLFANPKDVQWPQARIEAQTEWRGDHLAVTVSTDAYAYAVTLAGLPDLARPDDNYFDLFPGETRTILVRNLTEADARGIGILSGLDGRPAAEKGR